MWRTCGPPLSALRWRVERVSRADERGVADGRHGEVYGVERLRDEREGRGRGVRWREEDGVCAQERDDRL